MVDIRTIKKSATVFRKAMEAALTEGVFRGNPLLERSPNGSCVDIADLIGEYLLNTVDEIDNPMSAVHTILQQAMKKWISTEGRVMPGLV